MNILKKACMMRSRNKISFNAILFAVTFAQVLSVQAVNAGKLEVGPSIFSVYANNRERGIPNHITADLALVSYSLLRQKSIQTQEEKTIIPLFSALLNGLEDALDGQQAKVHALPEGSTTREALQKNTQLVQLVQSLMHPDRANQLDEEVKAEYTRIVNASAVHESSLWGRWLDYTQYKPRGRYTRDDQSEQFFRAFRYLSGQWFAIKPSAATGITSDESQLQTAQLIQLVLLMDENELLQVQRQALEDALDWQFGVAEDLRDNDVVQVLQSIENKIDYGVLSKALFDYAVEHHRQPSVIDAVVELNLLESGLSIQDVVSGWRLIPSRLSVQMATQQALLYGQTGNYVGDAADLPFTYGVVNGQGVKAYPSGREWLALIGGQNSNITRTLLQSPEVQFEGYEAAFETSQLLLHKLLGAELLHAEIIRACIDALESGIAMKAETHLDEQTLNGFQTWQRFLDVLYTRQSYTASAKGLMLINVKRESASLDIATDLYSMLAHVARVQWHRTEVVEWQAFADIMDKLVESSAKSAYGGALSRTDIEYLNNVDRVLLNLTGSPDSPVVVDVHTNPNENQVVQQGTGYARIVFNEPVDKQHHRGARFSFHEFKQPIAERLSVEQWRTQLDDNVVRLPGKAD